MKTRSRLTTHLTLGCLTVACMLLSARSAAAQAAQTIRCNTPVDTGAPDGICNGTMTAVDSIWRQPIRVRVAHADTAVRSVWVRFRATSGSLSPDTALTDANGEAATLWVRQRGVDPVGITAEVHSKAGSSTRYIHLSRPTAATVSRYRLRPHSGDGQAWFERSTLRFPLYVEVLRVDSSTTTNVVNDSVPLDASECRQQRVVFARFAGSPGTITPDTTYARVEKAQIGPDPARNSCFAHANWSLEAGAGYRHARANLVGDRLVSGRSSHQFEVTARAFPRLVAGLAIGLTPSYLGKKAGDQDTIRVERLLPDGSKLVYDSTFGPPDEADEVDMAWNVEPFVGVTTAIFPRWHRLAMTAGVNLTDPTEDWYLGISLPQLLGRLGAESFPVGLHLLSHWGRTPELDSPESCRTAGLCGTHKETRWHYVSVMASVDAGTLLSDLIKGLGL